MKNKKDQLWLLFKSICVSLAKIWRINKFKDLIELWIGLINVIRVKIKGIRSLKGQLRIGLEKPKNKDHLVRHTKI
jgi:hypothetical protein